jgi:hypothetical protein
LAVCFSKTRPFFLDGIEKFTTLNRLIYTRRIADPVVATRLTGKLSGVDVGFVSAVDDRSTSATGDYPVYNMLRLRRDLGSQSTTGFAYTDKIDGATRAPLFETAFDCTGRKFGCRYGVKAIHPDFQSLSGFVPRSGQVDVSTISRITMVEGRRGAFMEKLNLRWNTNWIWPYREFSPGDVPPETRFTFTVPMNIRGGWSVTPGVQWRTYEFPQASYDNLRLQRTLGGVVDTVPYLVPPRINDGWIVQLQMSSPQFPRFAFDANIQAGRDVNFTEPDRAGFLSFSTSADFRPTGQLRATASYNLVRRNRESDGTRFSTQHIPRLKVEYQLARPIFLRFVGQYSVDERAALRDPVTGFPLLQRTQGRYVVTTRRATNDLRVDVLFSYRPNPGTVVFFGYGSSLTETDAFQFSDMQRVRDGFFVKFSYLFRV